MKKLLLVRHAKAVHVHGMADFERPLKPSGIEDATDMAQRLHGKRIIPELIVSSPALRTLTTANIFSEHLAVRAIETDKKIYEATAGAILQVINKFPDKHNFIALVGHNPGMSEILNYLTRESKEMATGAVALISFAFDKWSEVSLENGTLLHYDEP